MRIKCVISALALACFFQPVAAETLTNDKIIDLVSAGLGDEAVIAKIRASDPEFNLATDQIIALKGRGVSGPVIAAMLDRASGRHERQQALSVNSPDPQVPHPSGVYLMDDKSSERRMQRIDATISNQAKTGGIFGYALTGGIASISVKASVQNESARVKASVARPTFYFFFDESNPSIAQSSSAWAAGSAATVTSPNEFTLIRLTKKQGRREARVGSMNIGGAKTGVMDKDRLAFDYELVRPGVYKVQPRMDLNPGEYGFIFSIQGGGTAGAMTAKIFDFSVL